MISLLILFCVYVIVEFSLNVFFYFFTLFMFISVYLISVYKSDNFTLIDVRIWYFLWKSIKIFCSSKLKEIIWQKWLFIVFF